MAEKRVRWEMTATEDVTDVLGRIAQKAEGVTSLFSKMSGVFAGLFAGFGIAGVTAAIKGVFDYADSLNDLSKKTGLTVETLDGLRLAAKQSGADLEGTAAAINKLSQNIGANAEKFRVIGVTAKDPLEAFKQLADLFVTIEDPQTRAALGAATLGKSWASAAPLLSEGSAKIQEMIDKGARLSGVTTEMARQADEFNDKMAELVGTGGALTRMVGPLLPLLNMLAEDLIKSSQGAGTLTSSFSPLLETGKAVTVLFANVKYVVTELAHEVVGLGERLVLLSKISFNLNVGNGDLAIAQLQQLKTLGEDMTRDSAARRKALDQWEVGVMAIGTAAASATPEISSLDRLLKSLSSDAASKAAIGMVRGLLDADEIKRAAEKALAEKQRMQDLDARGWVAYVEAMTREYEDGLHSMAKIHEEFFKDKERLQKLDDAGWVKKIEGDIEEYERALKEFASGFKSNIETVQTAALEVWSDVSRRGAAFFEDLIFSGEKAFDVLKRHLKSFVAELVSIFAQRWILQVGASALGVGGAGLASAAGQVGQGTLAGAAGTWLGGAASAGGAYLFGSAATGGAALAGTYGMAATYGLGAGTAATSGLMGSGGLMATLGSLGPVGWAALAVLAIAAVATAFRDKGENWEGRLGFGANAHAYTTQGVFGAEGFDFTQGQDSTNKIIQQFMASTGVVDKIIAATLTSSQVSTITANLAGAYTTRTDGQPATFAFGKGDNTAGAQFTLEYLQKKYGTVFDEIDKKFADFVRGYTGKSEDLIKEISAFAEILRSLSALNLAGLDIASLRAMQHDGEEIGATFTRITQGWSQLAGLFKTDGDMLTEASALLGGIFDGLGVKMPTTIDGWKALITTLDASTESGRALIDALSGVPGVVEAVVRGAQAALGDFDQLMGRLRPGYTDALGASQLGGFLSDFRGRNSWVGASSDEQLVAALRTITREDFANYDATSQRLILSILNLSSATQLNTTATSQVTAALAPPAGGYGPNIEEQNRERAWNAAKLPLRGWLDELLIGSTSPLDPQQKLDIARSNYERVRDLAKGGDVNAMGQLQGSADAYLRLLQGTLGSSSGGVEAWRRVFDEVAGIAGSKGYNERMLDAQADQLTVQQSQLTVLERLLEIQTDAKWTMERVAELTGDLPRQIQMATETAPTGKR